MFQNANFFLRLFVKSFLVPNNLQSDTGVQFMVEDFHDLVHNTATTGSGSDYTVKTPCIFHKQQIPDYLTQQVMRS